MNKLNEERTALIDLELILYSHAAKAESEGTGLRSLIQMTQMKIDSIVASCKASNYYLVVSGRNNFRKTLYPTYKAGRPPKPELYEDLQASIKEMNASKWCCHDQIEADDLLGIMLTNGRVKNPILCSIDKDMLGIAGWHYNWNKDAWSTYVSQEEADYNWLVQLLMGDSTDGIKGMEGIGTVKAKALIEKYADTTICMLKNPIWSAKYIYEKEGFSLDDFYSCLNTVTIWRNPFPKELLDNELIAEIVKTIPSLNTK
jgi:5'-3' exonuclease